MKLAIIAPDNLELAVMGDYQFALAQKVNDDNINWYLGRKNWDDQEIILDHGAFELGHPVMSDIDFLKLAERIEATTVIAPDVQWNPYETLKRSEDFASTMSSLGYSTKFKLMSVVWSAGPGDFGYWFKQHMRRVEPDLYGIGKWLESQYMYDTRRQLIRGLYQNFDVKPEQLHALGCPYAYEVYRLRNLVGSMDTGLAVKAALQLYPVILENKKYERIEPVPLTKLSGHMLSEAKRNAKYLLKLAHMR